MVWVGAIVGVKVIVGVSISVGVKFGPEVDVSVGVSIVGVAVGGASVEGAHAETNQKITEMILYTFIQTLLAN